MQNVVGILVASVAGAHPFYGLLIGSVSFVGGPGTAAAWAKEAQAMGLVHAPEIAVGAATLAVIVGAIVSGPVTGWLIRRRNLSGRAAETPAAGRSGGRRGNGGPRREATIAGAAADRDRRAAGAL